MKNKGIKLTALMLILFMAVGFLPSCAGKKGSGKKEIKIVTMYNHPVFEMAAQEYMKLHDDVSILPQAIPYDGYPEWLRVQMIAKTAPEVVFLEEPDTYANLGLLTDFNSYMGEKSSYDTAATWAESFEEPYIDIAKDQNSKLNWVPFSIYGIGLFVNADQYKAAGLEKMPETINEYIQNNAKLKQSGYTPLTCAIKLNDAQMVWPLEMMHKAFFRDLIPEINLLHGDSFAFDANNPKSVIGEKISPDEINVAFKKGLIDPAKSPRFKSMYEIMLSLVPGLNSDFLSKDGNEVYGDFANAKQTQFLNGTWYIPSLAGYFSDFKKGGNEDKIFNYNIIPFPKPTNENTEFLKAGAPNDIVQIRNGFAVPSYISDEKKEIAVDFIRFMTGPEMMKKMFELENPDTGFRYIGDIPLVKGVIGMEEAQNLKPEIKYADMQSANLFYDDQDRDNFYMEYQDLLGKKITLDEFLKKRSKSNSAAIERNLKLFSSAIDKKWMDEQIAKIQ